MKKITARILCSALASLMMFSSVSMPVLASDYSHVTSENSSDSVESSNESTGGEELKKQMEDLINEAKESSESEDQAPGVDDSENTADDVDNADENKEETAGDDNADESAGDEETEETALEDDAAISDITEALEEPGEEGTSNEDEERELLQTGNWSYYLDEDGYAHIAGYEDSEATSLLVPKKVGGYYVVALEEGAFTALSNLASVTIPFYIKNIDSDVFGSDVTIKAYHGTAAASYAAENGFAFENRSELDFADAVIDLTEIYRAHYSRIAELEFEFDRLEASYLEEGSVFYLAPSDEVPNGDIYKVITKEENGDSVTLSVERSVGKEALNSIHIDEDNLKPDWYTATYFADADDDGNYEEYSLSDMEKIGDEYLLNGFGSITIDKSPKASINVNINHEFTIKDTKDYFKEKYQYSDGLPDWLEKIPSVKGKVKVAGEIGIEETFSLKVDVDLLKAQINKLEFVAKEDVSYDCSFSGSITATYPIAVYSVPTPGLYEIKAEADIVFDVSGKISLVFKTTREAGCRYVDGEFVEIRSCDTDSGFEISGTYMLYLHAHIKCGICDIIELAFEVNCGLKLKLSAELNDFADSAESTLSLFFERKLAYTVKLLLFDLEKEVTFLPIEIVLYRSKLDTYTVKFMTGKSYANVPAQTVVKGGYATEPDTDIVYTNAAGQSVGIEGWYKDPQYRERFDFENTPIKEDTVIYGKTVSTHLVTLDYSSIELPEYTFEAPEGKKLAVESKKKMDYKFEGWYKDSDHKDRWNLETDLVPNHDIRLYANYVYQEGYNPWNDGVPENSSIVDDGITYSTKGFKYKIEDSGSEKYAVITGYEGDGGAVAVPSTVENGTVKVKSINSYALQGNKDITAIWIPDGITLNIAILYNCTNVERVKIEDVVFANGDSSYTGLVYLFDYASDNNKVITRHSALRKVTLTGNITSIRDYAFMNWTQLEEIDYPDTVTNIGSSAFDNCDGLKALPITENVRTIGGAAFFGCDGITRIDIPSGVREIGSSAFRNCANVTKISIPNNEIKIYQYAFANLPGVKELVIPNKVVLSVEVFYGCTGVEIVSIPDVVFANGDSSYTGLVYLFDYASDNNKVITRHSALRKVTLTGNITSIRDYAFMNWTQLEEIDYPVTVTAIGSCAFYNCSSLRRTVLPAGVKTISSNAFTGCIGLEEILVYADNLDISSIPFKKDADGNGITAVYGHVGSKAEECAERNNLPFEDIDEQFAPVTYVFNNGQDDAVSYERIGELITEPAVPYYNGFTFDKWYFDEGLTVPWDFEYDLLPACGITLYGDWKANESIVRNFTYEVNADEVTITGYVGLNGYVTIPEKIAGLPVTKLGDKAFAYDKDVIAITIPRTVEEIAQNCFIESPYISSITVSSGNESFVSEDGVLYDKEKTELILFPARKQAETYTIPDTVSRIRGYAFAGSELKEVVLGEGLEEIGDMAFSGCATLDKVTLPETVNTFGNFVFWNSPLVKVYGPVGNEDIEAFVAKELVDYNRYTLTFVSDGSVVSMYNIKAGEPLSDYLQDVLKSINKASYKLAQWTVEGDESKRAWNFDRDVMPQGDVTLEADWICMYSYSVTDDKATITGTGIDASDYVIPETIDGYAITGIAAGAFTGTSVESVTIPAAVTEIADGAFRSDVTIIADGDCAAADYAKADGLDFKVRKYPVVFESNGGTPVSTRYYTKGSKITVVPRPIKDNNNFRAWYKDEFLTAKWDFDNDVMPGEELTLYAGWNRIDENIEDDVFSYETNNGRLTITGYTGKSSYVEIPGAINGVPVTSIGEYAFAFNEIAGTVIIPDSVTTIDDKAFYNCHSLEKVTFGKNTEELGTAAFAGCTSLNRIDFTGTKITKIPDSCFMQAENLYFVTLSDNITEIGDSSFAGCTYLQSIELPAHLENIGRYAFFNDKVVKELTIPSAVKEIGESFVDGCTALGTINAGGNGSTYIGRDGILYRGNTLVRCPEGYDGDVNVPDDVINIGKGAFFHCTKVTAVILGKAVINVAASAFNGCRSLVSFSFAQKNKVMGISDFMFYGCSSLTSIVLPGEISSIGKSAFANCTALTRLRVGENVTFVGNTAFFGDDKLVIEAYADSAIDRYAAQENSLKLEYIADKALAPKAPEAESVVNTTITLKATEGYEYRIGDGQWQTSNVFEGLEPAKAYTFYQRVAESPYTKASNSSEGAVIVSGKYKGRTVKTPVVREVTSSSVTVVELPGCEYSIDGVNFSSEPEITNLRANREYTLYQRAAETQDTEAGEAASVTFRTPVHIGTCTVIFELDGGTLKGYDDSTAFATCETGDFVADPGEPVRKGYRFEGWFYGSELFDFTEPVDNDMTLVAGWTVRQQVQMPYSNIDGSAPVDRNTRVYLATGTIDARIYYTTDGSEPTVDSEHYEKPIIVTRDMTIRAIAVKEGSADSEVMTLTLAVNNAADLGDVAEEDIPASGDAGESPEERIPEKLWVAGLISEMPYTGSAITQQIRVYDHKTLLTEKKDYKLTYRNNTRVGTATVTVTGTGSYSGSLKLEFAITAPDIGDDTAFSAEDIYVSYNKKAQKPSAVLFHGGKKLKSGTDYTASWTNEKGEQGKGFTAAGDYEITLTGKGNYKGTRTLFFHVTESTLIGKVKLNKISAEQYTGDAVHPEIVLTDKKYTLVEGEDYIVEWPSDCTSVGNVTLLIKGTGKYAGTRSATFAIKGTALKSAAVTGIASSYGYEGEAVEPAGPEDDNTAPGVALLTATDSRTKGKISLIKGIDYTVSYRNNDKAGTATVVFTGTGRYTGSVSKTFRIAAYNLSRDVDNITAVYEKTDAYVKNGVKPSVSVYFRGMPLTEGTDYTLTYANNNAVTGESTKKLPSITIKGKGNFTGKYKTLNFTITRQDISGMNISVSDKVYVNKAKAYVSAPVITDASNPSAKLVAGKDYDKKLTYKYDEDTVVTQVVKRETVSYERHKGDEVMDGDILPAGAVVRVEAVGIGCYEGTLTGCYKIMKSDIAKATVKVRDQVYTGREIEPGKDQIISITIGKATLSRDDYIIESYTDNVKVGTATMIIRGRGIYGGTRKVTFKIVKKVLAN